MAEQEQEQEVISDPRDSIDKISDKLHSTGGHTSSSLDSNSYSDLKKATTPPSPVKAETRRPFLRENPVHTAFGADIFLWRNKNVSGLVLGVSTVIWVLFEFFEYHLLTLVCHIVIIVLSLLFMWSNITTIVKKKPLQIPEICLPEDLFAAVALGLRFEINRVLVVLREIASGRDLKKFLLAIYGLWALSTLGSFVNFLTLAYVAFVFLYTVPVLYEMYDDRIDAFAEKTSIEIKKQYAVFDSKVLRKIRREPTTM